jgi:cytochrome P450
MTQYVKPANIKELLALGPMPPVQDPYPLYKELRDKSPVYDVNGNVRVSGSNRSVLISRYQDVKAVIRDSETFSNDIVQRTMGVVFGPTIIGMDGKEHMKHRTLITPSMTTRELRGNDFPGEVRKIADSFIDKFIDEGKADLHEQFCYSFPLSVFVALLGIDVGDVKKFHDVSKDLCLIAQDIEKGFAASTWLLNFLEPIVQEKRRGHGGDLISVLVQSEVDGEKLSDLEVVSFLRLLTLAGAETTNHAIGSAFVAMLADRELMERVRADRSLVPKLLEETMRWESPVSTIMREAACDTQIGDVEIEKGTEIICHLGSANRDERQFANPDIFDIDRPDCDAIPFGYGRHYCAGSHLAKMEAEIGVNALLDRLGNIQVVPGEDFSVVGFSFRGPDRIPVTFDRIQ